MIVIKIGGGKTINIDAIVKDCKKIAEPFVIVHGANFLFDAILEKLNITKTYLHGPNGQISRYTTKEIIDVMNMTYSGLMNKTIVTKFQQAGISAIGLSGTDGKLIQGTRHTAVTTIASGRKMIVRNDLTGAVSTINTELLQALLKMKHIPVICPPAISEENEQINVDGDKIAEKIATKMQADSIVFLIEAPGLLKDAKDETSLIKKIQKSEIEKYLSFAQGRMKKKLVVSAWALQQGVKEIIIADGRGKYPITDAITHKKGTHIL